MTPPPAPAAHTPTHATVPADIDPRRITLTPGKKYPIHAWNGDSTFRIISDFGTDLFCLTKDCAHLNGRDWLLTTEPDVNAALLAALEGVVRAWVNPEDGSDFEPGEVPAIDAARTAIRAARGEG